MKGDKGWIIYRYTDNPLGSVMEVEVIESQDRRGYMTVTVPSMFGGGTFRCLVAYHQIHEKQEDAEQVNRDEAKNWKPEDK